MTSDKPKLTPESILTLLQIGSKRAEKHPKYWYQMDQKLSMYGFFKLMAVSKSFLNSSRKASYDIYRLHFKYLQPSDSVEISFKSKTNDSYGRTNLLYARAFNLLKFLQPPYLGADLDCDKAKILKIRRIFLNTDGKIFLNAGKLSDDNEEIKSMILVIRKFVHRVYGFSGDSRILTVKEPYAFPPLDCLDVSIENSGELVSVLRYNTKELTLGGWSYHGLELPADSTENLAVKKIELKFSESKYGYVKSDEIKRLSTALLTICPNVKLFGIDTLLMHYVESVHELPDFIADYAQRFKDLKARFADRLAYMSIDFGTFSYAGQRDKSWVRAVREKPIFNGWDIKFGLTEVDSSLNCHELTLKFSDDKCKFNIVAIAGFWDEGEEEYLEMYGQEAYDEKYNYDY